MTDEGAIKFDCLWARDAAPGGPAIDALLHWRNRLRDAGLVGEYPDGTGYGNVSIRDGDGFVITGTQTGGVARLDADGLTRVVEADVATNRVVCRGPARASSESLTHAAMYRCDPAIGAVVHVHDGRLWSRLLDDVPTSDPSVPYGTPAMAGEIARLYHDGGLASRRIAVMGGHRDGIITFGATIDEAAELTLRLLRSR